MMTDFWSSRYDPPFSLPKFLRGYLLSWRMLMLTSRTDGGHELQVSGFVRRLHGRLLVDVGANMGFYVRLLARNFDRMLAIEADPALFKYLKKKAPAGCELLNLAVSDTNGFTRLQRNPANLLAGASIMGNRGIEVRKASLSTILSEEPIVDLIKLDVESAEWLVLKGAEEVMERIRQWVIELHDITRKQELEGYMRRHGYACRWLDGNHAYFSR
jgi:FkbM family methyltransferase